MFWVRGLGFLGLGGLGFWVWGSRFWVSGLGFGQGIGFWALGFWV